MAQDDRAAGAERAPHPGRDGRAEDGADSPARTDDAELERAEVEREEGVRRQHDADDRVADEPAMRGDREGRQPGPAVGPADALDDVGEQAADRDPGARRRLVVPDPAQRDRRVEVGERVHQDRQGRADGRDQHTAERRPGHRGDGVGTVDPRVRRLQVLGADEARQERHRRGHVDHGGGAVGDDDHQQRRQRQQVEPPQQRDRQQEHGLHQVGAHHQRQPAATVDERADDQAEDQVGQPPRGVQPPDVGGRAVEGQHHERLEREEGDVGAQARHGLRPPVVREGAGDHPRRRTW